MNKPEEIVIPALETPGNKAKTWNKPIINEFFMLSLEYSFVNLVENNIIEVKKNPKPKTKNDEKLVLITSLNIKPNIEAGIVAIIRNIHILEYFLSKLNNCKISFLKKTTTASNDEKCKIVIKNKSGSDIKFWNKARCPDEEIGRNSVIAWMIANITSFDMKFLI